MRILNYIILSVVFFVALILLSCFGNETAENFPWERSVLNVSVSKQCEGGVKIPGKSCYFLHWLHPVERNKLEKYLIWLDTLVVNDSTQNVSQKQINEATKEKIYNYINSVEKDSLDLTEILSQYLNRDSVHLALWAKYSSGEAGVVQHIYIHFGDDVPPSIVSFSDSSSANDMWIDWVRPTDQMDFYAPGIINGPIAGYNILVRAAATNEDIQGVSISAWLAGSLASGSVHRFQAFRKNGRAVALEAVSSSNPRELRFAISDGKGFDSTTVLNNNFRVKLSGLKPDASYNVSIVAWDSAGNPSTMESRAIRTTDSIPPLVANRFRLKLSEYDTLPALDSNNRLVLFWAKSVDPLRRPVRITLDSVLQIPNNCYIGECYREVMTYSIEQWQRKTWNPIQRISALPSDYYSQTYSPSGDSMVYDASGTFVSDTIRFVAPSDTVILRIRAIDSSWHYSAAWVDTIVVSKGELWNERCPKDFVPLKRSAEVFCMEKTQHRVGNAFVREILFNDAVNTCKALSDGEFDVDLCSEDEWNFACTKNNHSYGVVEENNFSPTEAFLKNYCGAGTNDTLSAYSYDLRNPVCTNADGIRDLPGQLQEWVIGNGAVPTLKGTSYVMFENISRMELAQCGIRAFPTKTRPKYTIDTVYLYRSGSRIDTLFQPDTLRILYGKISPSEFTDTLLFYSLHKKTSGEQIGVDYIDQMEYRRRQGDKYLDVLWRGMDYKPLNILQVLINGTESVRMPETYIEPSVGFRCCARARL